MPSVCVIAPCSCADSAATRAIGQSAIAYRSGKGTGRYLSRAGVYHWITGTK